MIKIPRIKYSESKDTVEKVDRLFDRIGVDGVPEDLLEVRKKEILNHTQCSAIIRIYNNLYDLIGQRDDKYNRTLMDQWLNELIKIHAPIYYELPVWPENADTRLYEWEEWTIPELYSHYWELCMEYGWVDDKHPYEEHFRKYQIIDMLNDLLVAHKIIGYEPRSFRYEGDNSLDYADDDAVIPVKVPWYETPEGKKKNQINEVVHEINKYDNTSITNLSLVKSLDEKLKQLTDGTLGVRFWCLDDVLHCTVIIPNED